MLVAFLFSVRVIIQNIIVLVKQRDPKGTWEWAGTFLVLWILLIGVAVKVAVAAAAGGTPSTSSAISGTAVPSASSAAVRNMSGKNQAGGWLAVSIIFVFLLPALFIRAVLMEQPQRIVVSPTGIQLLYRLPWRNFSIDRSSIKSVDLHHSDYLVQGLTHAEDYSMIIEHDGVETKIMCNAWYQDQMKAAYKAAQTENFGGS